MVLRGPSFPNLLTRGRYTRRGNGELILVVARDPEVVDVLCPTLELPGYGVDVTDTGEAAIDRMERGGLHLVLVDTTLPDLPKIPRRRRDSGGPPVLFMVTGDFLDTVLPEVGLSGEDYVAKPVQIPELLARVWLLIRGWSVGRSEPLLRYGDLVLDDTSCRAHRGERELGLTPPSTGYCATWWSTPAGCCPRSTSPTTSGANSAGTTRSNGSSRDCAARCSKGVRT